MKITPKKIKSYLTVKFYNFGTRIRVFFAWVKSGFVKKKERKYYLMNAKRVAEQRRDIKKLKEDFKTYLKTVKKIDGKSEVTRLTRDFISCFKKYGIDAEEYFSVRYFSLTPKDREKIVSRWRQFHVVCSLNPVEYRNLIDDKKIFTRKFKDYINRVSLDMKTCTFDDFDKLFDSNEKIIIKPTNLWSGQGVYAINTKKNTAKKLFDDLKGKDLLAEEFIKQTGILHDVCPTCVNTVRIATLNDQGEITIFFAWVRAGRFGSVVDNLHAGGILWPVDHINGVISDVGFDNDGNEYSVHPDSGINMVGLKLPYWEEACETCKRIAREVPELSYISWDVVISDDKISIIEGNCNGGFWRPYSSDYDMWSYIKDFMDKKLGDKRPMRYF